MRFNIRTKLLISFFFIILVSILATVLNIWLLSSMQQKANHIFNLIDPVENAAYDLRQSFNVDIRAIEEYGNGFAEVDETETIVHAAEDKIAADIKEIERSGFVPKEYTNQLKKALEEDEVQDEKVFTLKEKEDNKTSKAMVSADLRSALIAFDEASGRVSKVIDEILNHLAKHRTEKINELQHTVGSSRLYIVSAFAASILVSFFIALITSYVLSKSVKKVRDAALKMSQGDFLQRTDIKSRDEIGELGKVFNQMAENIAKSQENLEKNDKELSENNEILEEQGLKLKDQLEQLRKFQRVTIDREMKMIALKEKLKECERDHGKK